MVEKDMDVGIAPDQVLPVLQGEGMRPSRQPVIRSLAVRLRCFLDDRPDESMAFAHDRFDESWPIRIVAEHLSYLPHRGIDRGGAIQNHGRAPQGRVNTVASDELAV